MSVDIISNILGNSDEIINNYIKDKFKSLYPDINPDIIDQEVLHNIIANIIDNEYEIINKKQKTIEQMNKNMISEIVNLSNNDNNNNINEEEKNKYELEIIKQNILMADEIIPEMSLTTNLIYLKGRLNGTDIKIMVDTGASSCVIFKSTIDACGMDYLIDSSSSVLVTGAHGIKPTLGTIWFCEIEIEVSKNNYISVPITIDVNDDSEIINAEKIIDEYENKINQLFKKKESVNKSEKKKKSFELILGMTFLKSYRANIDFATMTITLNKNIKIKFEN